MKRIISLFLVFIIAFTAVPFTSGTAYAASAVWDGTSDTSWYTGDKTAYDISTPQQLAGLAELVNSGNAMEGITFNLTADLVMNDTTGWTEWYNSAPANVFTPIGKSGNPVGGYYPFSGLFNGNGYKISGLYVKSGRTAGLFGYLYCAGVSSVIIEKSVIIGYDDLKGKGVYAGGITGIAEGSVISQCENEGYVYCVGQSDMSNGDRVANAGGIAGALQTENVSSVTLGMMFAAGGMFANPVLFNDGTGGFIKSSGVVNCISSGYIKIFCGTSGHIGGIVGWGNNGIVKNCLVGCGFAWEYGKTFLGSYVGTIYKGAICGGVYCCSMENTYYPTNYGINGIGDNLSSAAAGKVEDNAVEIPIDDMKTKEFVQRLGTSFTYIEGERPYLACDRRTAAIIERNKQLSDFVDRLYTILLGRNAEPSGLADWTSRLKSGKATSAEIVYGIAGSQEFAAFGLSNEEIVEKLYLAMLDRPSDAAGKAGWVNGLNSGMTVNGIINGFSGSQEFANICENYGIKAGSVSDLEPRDKSAGLTSFTARMYTKALGRSYDVAGLNDWTGRYLAGTATVSDIAYGFIFSKEFLDKNLSDSDYVDTLYRTFFDREPDEGGKADWLNQLKNGTPREDVLSGFVGSAECGNLVARFGI